MGTEPDQGVVDMAGLDAAFRASSGLTDRRFYKIFYSRIGTAPLLVLGHNPGGATDGTDLNASATFYENWEHDYVDFRDYGKAYSLAGPMYELLGHALGTTSEADIRRIPATNVIFRRSRNSAALDLRPRVAAHESAPVLAEIMRVVNPEAILLLGSTAFKSFTTEHCTPGTLTTANEPPELFTPNGSALACMFRSARAHVAALDREVTLIMVGHPSKYSWHAVWADVLDSVRRDLERLGISPITAAQEEPPRRAAASTRETPPQQRADDLGSPPAARTRSWAVLQRDVDALTRVCALLGLLLEDPHAPWPGLGKAVRVAGGGSVYINRGYADVRAAPEDVAAWHASGLGDTRPDSDRYLRVQLESGGLEPDK